MTLFGLKYDMKPKVQNMGVTLLGLKYEQNPKVLNLQVNAALARRQSGLLGLLDAGVRGEMERGHQSRLFPPPPSEGQAEVSLLLPQPFPHRGAPSLGKGI